MEKYGGASEDFSWSARVWNDSREEVCDVVHSVAPVNGSQQRSPLPALRGASVPRSPIVWIIGWGNEFGEDLGSES